MEALSFGTHTTKFTRFFLMSILEAVFNFQHIQNGLTQPMLGIMHHLHMLIDLTFQSRDLRPLHWLLSYRNGMAWCQRLLTKTTAQVASTYILGWQ